MKTLHLVCNAHIDPIWQWDWQEGASAALSTFQSAVDLADKYDYIFCHNEVTVYKYAEEYAPELFESIKKLVQCGKWHVVGGWYLQPDDNMPCGESFVRQIKTGQRYFKEKFGVASSTAFNVDAFGHSRGLVQIIKKCGQDSLIVCRPHTDELALESDCFLWEGFDGSVIKVYRSPDGYNSPLGNAVENIREKLLNRSGDVMCVMWGVGNHGGGPSDKDLGDIKAYIGSEKSIKVLHSTPENFFSQTEPLYKFDKSLLISMPGCYTSSIEVKRLHKQLENQLYLAEIMASAAALQGLSEYPVQTLEECFEDLMNGEFHDVLPGSCVKAGEDNGIMLFNHGLLGAARIITKAFFALCRGQRPAGEGEYPIIVFNPHPYRIIENVECEFSLKDQNWSLTDLSRITVKDGNQTVRSQTVKEDSNLNLDWRKRVIFEAALEPMSVKRLSVYADFLPAENNKIKEEYIFDDGRRRVEIDPADGLLKSYSIDGTEYVKDGFCLTAFDDNPDPWAMGKRQKERLGTNPEKFALLKKPDGVFKNMRSVQVIENGDIYLGVEAFFGYSCSKARIEYRIYKNRDDIDVNVTLYMQDCDKIFKLAVPVPDGGRALGQTAFGTEELFCDGRENVSQRFTAIEKNGKFVSISDNCRYGSHYENGILYLSLARGTTYCAHPIEDRQLIPSGRYTKKMDQGVHEYSFRLSVCDEAELERVATEFNRKPYAVNVFPVKGERSPVGFSFEISDKNVTLAAFKKLYGKDAYAVRLLNNTPDARSAEIAICGARVTAQFGKYEVKTFLFNGIALNEVNGMEI